MKNKFRIFWLSVLVSGKAVYSQNIDSLLVELAHSKKDSNKVILLNTIASAYFNQDKDKSWTYTKDALRFAKEIGYTRGEAKAWNSIGILIQKDGNYDSAMVVQNRSLVLYKSINDKKGIAKALSDIANVYWRKSEFSAALESQLNSLKISEEIRDLKGEAYSYNMIGIIYKNLKKDTLALKYYHKSEAIKLRTGDKTLPSTYQNIGNIYKSRIKRSDKKNWPAISDSAMKYYRMALMLHKKNNNKTGESFVVSGIGDLNFETGRYKEAKQYYLTSLDLEKASADSNTIATSYINIGNACTALKNYQEADEYIHKGLSILEKLGDAEGVMSAYEMLAYLWQEKGDYKKALEYTVAFHELKDSVIGLKEKSAIAELQTQYEVEKKDLQLAKDKAEIDAKARQVFIKNIIIGAGLVLLVLIVVTGVTFYRKKQIEQKAKHEAEMAAQKELRTKAILEAEEKERRRIAQDLHDGVGQILSAAKLNLSSFASQIKLEKKEEKDALKNAVELIDDSVKEVRAVSHNMMPNTLIKLGLASAVREFITKIGNLPNLKIDLEIVGLDKRISDQIETVLYRVIQETVNNIIKHAKANHISLQLIKHETEVTVMIEDNGVGFDTSKINEFSGIGLKNIISRIEFLNGSVHFDSTPGHGTNVIIELPTI